MIRRRFRSSITGRIVKAATAKRHPDTTVAEVRADVRAELERLRELERYPGEIADLRDELVEANTARGDLVEALIAILQDPDEPLRPRPIDAPPTVDLVARHALEALELDRGRTGVDEWDESDARCELMNLATEVAER